MTRVPDEDVKAQLRAEGLRRNQTRGLSRARTLGEGLQ